jgi:hypothetical protein
MREMAVNPTGTQAENDQAATGHTVVNKVADGSAADPNTPPWLQALPANVTLPVITGTATVGSTLQCSTGSWNYPGMAYAYQWLRAGANIAGATASSYVVVTADKTFAISCTVTATNAKGSTPATSAATAAVP